MLSSAVTDTKIITSGEIGGDEDGLTFSHCSMQVRTRSWGSKSKFKALRRVGCWEGYEYGKDEKECDFSQHSNRRNTTRMQDRVGERTKRMLKLLVPLLPRQYSAFLMATEGVQLQ